MLRGKQRVATLKHEQYMDEVAPHIWLGEKRAAFDDSVPILRKHGITHVVSIGYYDEWWKFRPEPKHMVLQVEDSPFACICDHFEKAFHFMDEALYGFRHHANNNSNDDQLPSSSVMRNSDSSSVQPRELRSSVLVHCEQGRSRSGAMVIAYLMKKNRQSYPETLNKVLIHRKRVMPNIGFQIQLRTFGKHGWKTNLKYFNDIIDIEKELGTALKNLAQQVSRLQMDIRQSEKIFVTVESADVNDSEFNPGSVADVYVKYKGKHGSNNNGVSEAKEEIPTARMTQRLVRIGLSNDDLSQFKKEWVLLVFLSHQFQLYRIGVHKSIVTILQILGEMYFEDLVQTFIEVFEPQTTEHSKYLVVDYNDPVQSIRMARKAHHFESQKRK